MAVGCAVFAEHGCPAAGRRKRDTTLRALTTSLGESHRTYAYLRIMRPEGREAR